MIAAGPQYLVVAINSLLAIYDKSGTRVGGTQDFKSFFSALGINGEIFDPRIVYDQGDGRFILSAAEVDFTNFSNGTPATRPERLSICRCPARLPNRIIADCHLPPELPANSSLSSTRSKWAAFRIYCRSVPFL